MAYANFAHRAVWSASSVLCYTSIAARKGQLLARERKMVGEDVECVHSNMRRVSAKEAVAFEQKHQPDCAVPGENLPESAFVSRDDRAKAKSCVRISRAWDWADASGRRSKCAG